jgi:hypothetical protein
MTSKYKPGDKVWVKAEVLPARSASTFVFLQVTDAVGPVGHLMHPKDIRRRVKRKAPASAWQPIDTAPKDGQLVLVAFRRCIYTDDSRNRTKVREAWLDPHCNGGTWWLSTEGYALEGPEKPTHWMPLPEPPKP